MTSLDREEFGKLREILYEEDLDKAAEAFAKYVGEKKNLLRLHDRESDDDLYELVQYVRSNGQTMVTPKKTNSRALGVKPFSSVTEEAFCRI